MFKKITQLLAVLGIFAAFFGDFSEILGEGFMRLEELISLLTLLHKKFLTNKINKFLTPKNQNHV